MRAVVVDQGVLQFQHDYPLVVRENEDRVRVQLAGICETDLQLVDGYMGFSGVLGHEFIGTAETGQFAGQRVVGEINCACGSCSFCRRGLGGHCPSRSVIGILNHDGAFADVVYVPTGNLHPVPDSLPDEVAVFTEPLAAAFQIPAQIALNQFGNVAVIGDGRLAFLIAQVLRLHLNKVLVVGKHPNKLAHFEAIGLATEVVDTVEPMREFDLAVDCTGSITGIPTALSWLRPRGTLVLKTTVAGDQYPNLAAIVIDEIQVIGSRCGPFERALAALAAKEIEVQSMITARFPIESAVQAFETATAPTQRKVLLELESAS